MFEEQQLSYWCGPASVTNSLLCFGEYVPQEKVAKLCHVTAAHGTDEDEIQRAVLACGYNVAPWHSKKRRESATWIYSQLRDYGPAILAVENEQHWVTAVGLLESRILVWDPASGAGLKIYGPHEFMLYWRLHPKKKGPSYFGIGVSEK